MKLFHTINGCTPKSAAVSITEVLYATGCRSSEVHGLDKAET